MKSIVAALAVCVLGFGSGQVLAAEFALQEGEPNRYGAKSAEIRMTGAIEEGDAERLAALVRGRHDLDFRNIKLRMNSPGGSLYAGIALGKQIQESGVRTWVGPGDSCLSACALAFMFGAIPDGDGHRDSSRTLNHMGVLGFHAPFAFGKEDRVPEEARTLLLADAERSAREAGSLLIGQSASGILPSTLIEELLLVEQADFLFVDTVDRAARWEIKIEGGRPLHQLHHKRLEAYCSNVWAWENSIAFENRTKAHDVVLLSLDNGNRLGTAMMEFSCELELSWDSPSGQPVVILGGRAAVLAWQSLPGDTPLLTLGPQEIVGATGPTWDERFPKTRASGSVNYDAIRNVSGQCRNRLIWQGGWYGKDGSEDYADFAQSYAHVAACGGGFGPMGIRCLPNDNELEFRFAYASDQQPNIDGLVVVNIDGDTTVLMGRNGDVFGHEQVYVNVAREHPLLDKLKKGSTLKLVGDGPNQEIHLLGSRAAIEAMQLACP